MLHRKIIKTRQVRITLSSYLQIKGKYWKCKEIRLPLQEYRQKFVKRTGTSLLRFTNNKNILASNGDCHNNNKTELHKQIEQGWVRTYSGDLLPPHTSTFLLLPLIPLYELVCSALKPDILVRSWNLLEKFAQKNRNVIVYSPYNYISVPRRK